MYPKCINDLIETFKLLPGIGEKTAERYAFALINFDEENIEYMVDSIKDIKKSIHKCKICNSYTDQDECIICQDKNRNNDILCVLEDPKSVFVFEKTNTFNGRYHVIDGLISPTYGINPEDIGLEKLIKRIEKEKFKEVVIAVKQSVEGEITGMYIKRILEGMDIKVTRIASGIPVGADIEYIDAITLEQALTNRKTIE